MTDTILFDYDGTIIDTNKAIIYSFNKTSQHFIGRDLKEEEFYFMFGKVLEFQMDYLLPEKSSEACKFYRNVYNSVQEEMVTPFPQLIETLKMIKERNIKIGLVSSNSMVGIVHGIDKFAFGQYIDTIVSSDDTNTHKPDPTPLLIILDKLGSIASSTLMIGDSPYDIEAGIRANIKTVLVDWSIFPEYTFRGMTANYRINSLPSLIDIL